MDGELFLPEAWFREDLAQVGEELGIPEERQFETKLQLGLKMLKRVKANGLPFELLACDAFYGRDAQFRAEGAAEGVVYAAQVPADTRVYLGEPQVGVPQKRSKRGRSPIRLKVLSRDNPHALRALGRSPQTRWQRVQVRHTERGRLPEDFAVLRGWTVAQGKRPRAEWSRTSMVIERRQRACLWLRVSTDSKGQDPELQRAGLERVCEQWGWQITKTYEVEESAFGKKPREQFQAMLEDARKGKFDVLVVWSLDRFSREGEWSVSRIMAALQDWNIRFYSYNEPFLDTTGPFAGFLIPLFTWLARQESIRKGKAVRLGMEKAKARGKAIGRPVVVERVDSELVVQLRSLGKSWRKIAEAHPAVKSRSGKKVKPSVGSIRRAFVVTDSTDHRSDDNQS